MKKARASVAYEENFDSVAEVRKYRDETGR